jgi:hypothetical protein
MFYPLRGKNSLREREKEMADIFDKIASDFVKERSAGLSQNKSSIQRVASLAQPLRLQHDYGDEIPGSAVPRVATTFQEFDADKDEKLSPSEWQGAFDAIDDDDDGFISDTEWENDAFEDLDLDDDGVISKDEWENGFDALDEDEDGFLSEEEFNGRTAEDSIAGQNDPHHFYIGDRYAEDGFSDDEDFEDFEDEDFEDEESQNHPKRFYLSNKFGEDLEAGQNDPRHFYLSDKFSDSWADDDMAFEKADEFGEFDPEFEEMVRVARITSKEVDPVLSKKQFEEFKENNPDFAETWEENTDEYKDVVKDRAKATQSEDFQEAEEELDELEERVEQLEAKKEKIVEKATKKAHGMGSYMSIQNIKQMREALDVLEGQVHAGEELEDWVENKITEAKVHLDDLAGYFGYGRGYHTHPETF